MNPLDFLTRNQNLSFEAFKVAYPDVDPNKLKMIYDTVKKPSTQSKTPIAGDLLNSLFSDKNISNATKLATQVGVTAGALMSIPTIIKNTGHGAMFSDISEELNLLDDTVNNLLTNYQRPMEVLKGLFKDMFLDQVGLYLRQQTGLLTKMNGQVGMTGQLSKDFRNEISEANPQLLRLGVGFEELVNFSSELIINTGKFTQHNRESLIEVGEISKAYIGTMSDLGKHLPNFEKIGYGMVDTARTLEKSGKESLSLGLRSQTVIEQIGENIEKVNSFGFKNGVQGLSKMVQKSLEFRTNMSDVFNVAEKVWDLTDSINLSAELQSIGGAVGDFMDPFKLSYMATNNVEGIQDALIEMSKGLATYNDEQKRFEVTGVNLRVAREYSQKLGVDMKTLTEGAIAASEKQQAHNELLARGLVLNKDQERFLTNISQMKNGAMTIELTNKELRDKMGKSEIQLKDLTESQKDTLMMYQSELEAMNSKDIIKDQVTIMQGLSRDVAFLAATARLRGGKYVETAAKVTMYDKGFNKEYGDVMVNKGLNLLEKESKTLIKNLKGGFLEEFGVKLDPIKNEKREKEIDKKIMDDRINAKSVEDGVTAALLKNNHINPQTTRPSVTNNYVNNNERSFTRV